MSQHGSVKHENFITANAGWTYHLWYAFAVDLFPELLETQQGLWLIAEWMHSTASVLLKYYRWAMTLSPKSGSGRRSQLGFCLRLSDRLRACVIGRLSGLFDEQLQSPNTALSMISCREPSGCSGRERFGLLSGLFDEHEQSPNIDAEIVSSGWISDGLKLFSVSFVMTSPVSKATSDRIRLATDGFVAATTRELPQRLV